jgi:hypothetical protein
MLSLGFACLLTAKNSIGFVRNAAMAPAANALTITPILLFFASSYLLLNLS